MQLFTLNDIKIEVPKFTYSPGELITGKVVTYLREPTKADNIRLRFYGTASINTKNTTYTSGNAYTSEEREVIEFGGQEIILAGTETYTSYEYPFCIQIPLDIFPKEDSRVNQLPQDTSGWTKIATDILSQAVGVRQFIPTYRFFLDVNMEIPWAVDIHNTIEISIMHRAPGAPTAGNI